MSAAVAIPAGETFPLHPRHRLHGLELGPFASSRRGSGSDPAGSRLYEPGDDVRAIDWAASARLSSARGSDDFVVRERYAEQAPRVVVVCDRRPGMGLYGPPWLSKPAVLAACEQLIGESAFRARGLVGELRFEGEDAVWHPPAGNPRTWRARLGEGRFDAAPGTVAEALDRLSHLRALPAGSFVFVLSDLLDPVPDEGWLAALAHGWDVVPVIVRDPTWEASFPAEAGGVVLPLADPATGAHGLVRLSPEEARARREEHERRLAGLVGGLADLGLDPVVLTTADGDAILGAFLAWAAARAAPEGRAW